ncbi:DUF1674 domain-containing protein [Rhizobium sp. KVB221]|uniref:DUF1674 domain-containing protein n=1 Tax=Rhizobium setariae TaxID=2801340 RepID=A0A937CMB9_9HYPH|nr:DUF1674 domain-containing protein [Rhizobium setariae]MBL0374135.1 DUF1674 domain-containing protein [Rhizobium setariae]
MTAADNDNAETGKKPLTPAAIRALKEAEERRRLQPSESTPVEIGGRGGADPARYGDWEVNGRAIDF